MGNICRSPLLEGWARHRFATAGRAGDADFDSAGTGGWHVGRPPDPRAIAAAARRGVDIRGQRARLLVPGDFDAFDLVLCADRDNLREARQRAGGRSRARVALALEWAGAAGALEVPDPYTGVDADFDHVCTLADTVAAALLQALPRRA